MHEMLCIAGQNLSRKMDGEACPAGGFRKGSGVLGSWSDVPRSGTAVSGIVLFNLNFQNLKEVLHESFVFTSSTFTF